MKTIVTVTSETKVNNAFAYKVPIEHDAGVNVMDILELAFRETNRVDGNEYISKQNIKCCSSSVGHFMEINGSIYLVCGIGFKLITQEEKNELLKLPSLDRQMKAFNIMDETD